MKKMPLWILVSCLSLSTTARPAEAIGRRGFLEHLSRICSGREIKKSKELKFTRTSAKLTTFETGLEIVALNTMDLLREMGWLPGENSKLYDAYRWRAWQEIIQAAENHLSKPESSRSENLLSFEVSVPFGFQGTDLQKLYIEPRFEISLSGEWIETDRGREPQILAVAILGENGATEFTYALSSGLRRRRVPFLDVREYR